MSTKWADSIVGEHIELVYGKSLPDRDRQKGEFPVYGSNGIVGQHNQFVTKGPGIVIGRKGTVGQVTLSKKDFWPIDTTYYVKLKQDGDIFYWFYLLQTFALDQMNSHSAVPGLNRDNVYSIPVKVPSLVEQKRIAKILCDLDNKIELNQQMNKTLEAMAQALFKEWFVDFRFPGYEKVKFVDGLPEGWEEKTISECGQVICGKTPPTADKENYGVDISFITIPDMRGNPFVIKTERRISFKGASTQRNKELPPYSICVSCIATPGLVSMTSEASHTNQQINSIVSNRDISPFFVYCTLLDKSEDIKTMGLGGTATLNLNTGDFARIKIVVPTDLIMKEFHTTVEPLFEKVLVNAKESLRLCALRDSLLPKLMNGGFSHDT